MKKEIKWVLGAMSAVILGVIIFTVYVVMTEEPKKKEKEPEKVLQEETLYLPKQDINAKLPEVDKSLLSPKTYDALATLYNDMKEQKIEASQFQSTAEQVVKYGLKGLKQHIEKGQIEYDTGVDLFIYTNMLLTFVSESDWYTPEDLEQSQWMTLITAMSMLEIHFKDYDSDYEYRYEVESNHLTALVNMLADKETQNTLGYTLPKELTKEVEEYLTSKAFLAKFEPMLQKLSDAVKEIEAQAKKETGQAQETTETEVTEDKTKE